MRAGPPALNPLYAAREERLARGAGVVDLTSGNVNEHGISFPAGPLAGIMARALEAARVYRPHPLGQPAAREAVSAYYRARGVEIPAARIVLTPGTSVSYLYAMSLLASPGDEFLCPSPSYPLFESIADLAGVTMVPYHLREAEGWTLDAEELEAQVSTRTRAVILISPHNPTGAVASREAVAGVRAVARRHGFAVLHDEVFSEFLHTADELPRAAGSGAGGTADEAPLVLTLNGLSKMFALPGMKVGWIGVSGAAAEVTRFMAGVELVSDTFLPVNEAAQFALPEIFTAGEAFLPELRAWIGERRRLAVEALRHSPAFEFTPPAGGIHLALRFRDAQADEEAFAVRLLRERGVLVHPGHFYDMSPPHLAMTFVHGREELVAALRDLVALAGI
jgi:alanine-synthesizing transaminase